MTNFKDKGAVLMDVEANTPGKMSHHVCRWLLPKLPRVKGEVVLITMGLYLGILMYYSRRYPWSLVGLGILTLTAFYLALSLKYRNPVSPDALHITGKQAGLHLIAGLFLILPAWFFSSLLSYLGGNGWLSFGIVTSPLLILSIVLVALSEEMFFRGYLLGRLKSFGGNRWARVVLVSAAFIFYKVLIHCWEGRPFVVHAQFFALGMFQMLLPTLWVDRTGSILATVVIHIGWDLIMFHEYTDLPYWAL